MTISQQKRSLDIHASKIIFLTAVHNRRRRASTAKRLSTFLFFFVTDTYQFRYFAITAGEQNKKNGLPHEKDERKGLSTNRLPSPMLYLFSTPLFFFSSLGHFLPGLINRKKSDTLTHTSDLIICCGAHNHPQDRLRNKTSPNL